MDRAEYRLEPAKASVLLFTQDQSTGRSYVEALEKATVPVEWVKTASALRSRLLDADLPRPTLVMVLPSPRGLMRPTELARVVLRLTTDGATISADKRSLHPCVDASTIIVRCVHSAAGNGRFWRLYLVGNNDKEIASSFNCSATTVYEHWRRMAKKANGRAQVRRGQ